jgi:hypothetical protein
MRHKLSKQRSKQHADPEARGILGCIIAAQTLVNALPEPKVVIVPPPTPFGTLQRLLAGRNHR